MPQREKMIALLFMEIPSFLNDIAFEPACAALATPPLLLVVECVAMEPARPRETLPFPFFRIFSSDFVLDVQERTVRDNSIAFIVSMSSI